MADDAPELLHLLKAGRILQYRQQNVALVSADEGVEFDITYAERWLAPDLDVAVGDGAVIILSDSPYAKIDPARYATVTAAERNRSGLRLTVKVGPWPVVEDPTALRPPNRPHPSGAPFFAWRAPADGMRPPRSDHEAREAWRDVVAGLRGNQFYADSNFARIVRVLDPHGHEVRERRLELGEAATAVVEVHSPGGNDHVHSVLVDSDPPGSVVGGIEKERADAEDHLHVPVRPLAAGTHTVDLSFVPEPLLSTRLSFTINAHRPSVPAAPVPAGPAGRATDGPVTPTVDAALVQGLVQRLSRIDAIDPVQWLDLLLAHVLPSPRTTRSCDPSPPRRPTWSASTRPRSTSSTIPAGSEPATPSVDSAPGSATASRPRWPGSSARSISAWSPTSPSSPRNSPGCPTARSVRSRR